MATARTDGADVAGDEGPRATEGEAPDGAPDPAGAEEGGTAELPERGPLNPRKTTVDQTVQLTDLLAAVEDGGRVVILTHDNPDPDALAASAALAFLFEKTRSIESTLAFGGIVGRAENRALMEEMGVQFRRIGNVTLDSSTVVALVDTQPRTGNNSLPEGRIATVVVDHHPLRPETSTATFADVRPDYGASCSILVEYLRAAKLEPDRRIATGLFYGIQSETMDLGREVSAADVSASLYLYPRSEPASISRIRHARVPASYFQSMHEALERARRYGGVIFVPMGRLDYPDMCAEVADLFMRVHGVDWTVVSGRYHDDLLLSVRTYDPHAHAGRMVRETVRDRGSAGGHGMLAGAQIPLKGLSDAEVEELVDAVFRDIREELGVAGREPEPLVGALATGEAPAGEAGPGRGGEGE